MSTMEQAVKPICADGALEASRPTNEEDDVESVGGAFREMFSELVHSRELLWRMTSRDLRIRYKQAVMGFGWAVFMPMLIVTSGFLVKYAMARLAGQELGHESLAAMAVKSLPWAFFVGGISFATTSMTGNMNLITKIYFPREVFPLSSVLTQAIDTSIGATALGLGLAIFLHVTLSWQLLWLIPLTVLTVLLTAGLALLLSCGNLFFRDVKYLVQVFLTFGIFFAPVFYEPEVFGPRGCVLAMLNPIAPLLEGYRLAVVEHHNLLTSLWIESHGQWIGAWQPWYLLYSAIWAIGGFFGAWYVFHKFEFVYAEYV